jgi:hypothetical protein
VANIPDRLLPDRARRRFIERLRERARYRVRQGIPLHRQGVDVATDGECKVVGEIVDGEETGAHWVQVWVRVES